MEEAYIVSDALERAFMVLDFSVYVLIWYNSSRPAFVHSISIIAGFVWVGLYIIERLRPIAYRILRERVLDTDLRCDWVCGL